MVRQPGLSPGVGQKLQWLAPRPGCCLGWDFPPWAPNRASRGRPWEAPGVGVGGGKWKEQDCSLCQPQALATWPWKSSLPLAGPRSSIYSTNMC